MINRRHLLGIVPLAATLLLAGCAADSQTEQGQTADGLRAIRLTATVGDGARADTRAAIDIQSEQFEQGETFYAHFPSGASVTNSTFETSDASGNTTCTGTQPYFNAGVNSVTVHAYYPQTVTEAANQTFSVALDQTGKANYKASDLMYATTDITIDKATETSKTANLTFSHKMSKIIVNASCGQGVSKIKKVRIVNGFKTIGIANPTTTAENTSPFFGETPSRTNAITTADDGCVKLYEDATGGASVNCAGLIPPQTITGSFLQVVTSEGTATYSLASKTFASGESYTYSFTVSLASIGITTDITNWGTTDGTTTLVDGGTEKLYYCSGIALTSSSVAVGMIICEHGKVHAATSGNLTTCSGHKVAIVAYKGEAGSADKSSGSSSYKGLALAITDVGGETASTFKWYTGDPGKCITNAQSSTWATASNTSDTNSLGWMTGIENTNHLAGGCGSDHVHAAAQAAVGYESADPHPSGTSQWFLPTIAQWKLMLESIRKNMNSDDTYTLSTSGQDAFKSTAFQSWFDARGGKNFEAGTYWSSVEYNTLYAWFMNFSSGNALNGSKVGTFYVRPVLAF